MHAENTVTDWISVRPEQFTSTLSAVKKWLHKHARGVNSVHTASLWRPLLPIHE